MDRWSGSLCVRGYRMRQLIALLVILMVVGLAGLFAWFAYTLREDVRARFGRIQQKLATDAIQVMRHLLTRR